MNKSAIIRATPGTPTEVVRTLAAQGIEVSLNLVKQVLKNQRRAEKAASLKYKKPKGSNRGKKTAEIKRLLGLGFTPSQITERYPGTYNLAKQVAFDLAHPGRKRARKKASKKKVITFDLDRQKRRGKVVGFEMPSPKPRPLRLEEPAQLVKREWQDYSDGDEAKSSQLDWSEVLPTIKARFKLPKKIVALVVDKIAQLRANHVTPQAAVRTITKALASIT